MGLSVQAGSAVWQALLKPEGLTGPMAAYTSWTCHNPCSRAQLPATYAALQGKSTIRAAMLMSLTMDRH